MLKFCGSFALFHSESQAHTVGVEAARHRVVATVRYAAASSVVDPATTAQHVVSPTCGTSRVCLWATVIAVITVIAPLP